MARAQIDVTLDTDRVARALDVVSKHAAACAAELREIYPEGPPPIVDLDEAERRIDLPDPEDAAAFLGREDHPTARQQ